MASTVLTERINNKIKAHGKIEQVVGSRSWLMGSNDNDEGKRHESHQRP